MIVIGVIGAVLIGIGLLALILAFNSKKGDMQLLIMITVSILLIIIGGWMMLSSIDIMLLIQRIIGILLAFSGLFLLIKFPTQTQHDFYLHLPLLLGVIFLIIGVYLTLF